LDRAASPVRRLGARPRRRTTVPIEIKPVSDTHRASFLVRLLLFVGVVLYGWACGSSPFVTALLSRTFRQLAAPARVAYSGTLAPAFRPEVLRWEGEIVAWSQAYGLDPNLVATIMQVESCGDPRARSGAGATGLFQVMPFHFAQGEDMYDPPTNAARGLAFFAGNLERTGGDVGLALAAYNGGRSLIARPASLWPRETQRYYDWGTGIYSEVSAGHNPSPTLERWLAAGGRSLCAQAAARAGWSP
jgi:hypothetical protein